MKICNPWKRLARSTRPVCGGRPSVPPVDVVKTRVPPWRFRFWSVLPAIVPAMLPAMAAAAGAAAHRGDANSHRAGQLIASPSVLTLAKQASPLKVAPVQDFGFLGRAAAPEPASPRAAASTGVVLDSTLVAARPVPFAANAFTITPDLGKQVGPNLFESFGRLDLARARPPPSAAPLPSITYWSASPAARPATLTARSSVPFPTPTFTSSTPPAWSSHPALKLDLQGSFAVTTANVVRLAGGGGFAASTAPAASTLTAAAPAAFGFTDASPQGVQVNGATLQTNPGKSISVVAGGSTSLGQGIQLAGGAIVTSGGRVNLISVNSPGDVVLDASSATSVPDVSAFAAMGDVSLLPDPLTSNPAAVQAPGGGVTVRAANLNIGGGNITAMDVPAGPLAAIDVVVTGDMVLSSGSIHAGTDASAPAGAIGGGISLTAGGMVSLAAPDSNGNGAMATDGIFNDATGGQAAAQATATTIHASSVVLSGGAVAIESSTSGVLNGADIILDTASLDISNGALVQTTTSGPGNAGNVIVPRGQISITGVGGFGFSGIQTSTNAAVADTGRSGDIILGAALPGGQLQPNPLSSLTLSNGGGISSQTYSSGNAGNITVFSDSIIVDGATGASAITSSTAPSIFGFISGGGGDAGAITLGSAQRPVGNLQVINGGSIFSSALAGSGRGGDIVIFANHLAVAGSDMVGISGGASIGSETITNGDAGNITLGSSATPIGTLQVLNSGVISAGTFGAAGKAGNISVNSKVVHIDGQGMTSGIDTSTVTEIFNDENGNPLPPDEQVPTTGDGGNIRVSTTTLSLTAGGQISAETASAGRGGSISVTAGLLNIDGKGGPTASGTSGSPGNLAGSTATGILADALTPVFGPPANIGGAVAVQAHQLTDVNGGSISASAQGQAIGGNVTLEAHAARFAGGSDATSSAADGAAGLVSVSGGSLMLDNASFASAATGAGNAGSVKVQEGYLSLSRGAQVSVSAAAGSGGDVQLYSRGGIDLSGSGVSAASAGNGGNVTVSAGGYLNLLGGTVTSQAGGNGGRITLSQPIAVLRDTTIDGLSAGMPVRVSITGELLSQGSRILTDTPQSFPTVDLSGSLAVLHAALGMFLRSYRTAAAPPAPTAAASPRRCWERRLPNRADGRRRSLLAEKMTRCWDRRPWPSQGAIMPRPTKY